MPQIRQVRFLTNCLRGNSNDEQISKLQAVICDDLVLKSADHSHCSVETVSEQEVSNEVSQTLTQMPDVDDGVLQLLQSGDDDVALRILTRTSPFDDEPWNSAENPDSCRKGDEDRQSPIVILYAVVDMQAEHDAYNDC